MTDRLPHPSPRPTPLTSQRRRRSVDLGILPADHTPHTAANVIPGHPAHAGTDDDAQRLAGLVVAHWRDFFGRFREDEHGQEQVDYLAAGAAVQQRLDALGLGAGARPDIRLMADLLETLLTLERSRFGDLSGRIDELSSQVDQQKLRAQTATMVKTHQVDEIQRCAKGLVSALKGARMPESSARQVQEILTLLRKLVESTASHRRTPRAGTALQPRDPAGPGSSAG